MNGTEEKKRKSAGGKRKEERGLAIGGKL